MDGRELRDEERHLGDVGDALSEWDGDREAGSDGMRKAGNRDLDGKEIGMGHGAEYGKGMLRYGR